MDFKKVLAYTALFISAFLLWNAWQIDHAPAPTATEQSSVAAPVTSSNTQAPLSNFVPSTPQTAANSKAATSVKTATGKIITVKTDVLDVDIDTLGGNLVQSGLINYPQEINTPNKPYTLLDNSDKDFYQAQSGLIGPDGALQNVQYSASQSSYQMSDDQKEMKVSLNYVSPQGLDIVKTYTFTKGKYQIGMAYTIKNTGSAAWSGHYYAQLARSNTPPVESTARYTYFGAAISSPDKHYKKLSFKDMAKQDLDQSIKGGWAAMLQHYFVSAWVPNANETFQYYSKTNNEIYTLGMLSPSFTVAPGQTVNQNITLYSGPAIATDLNPISPTLKLAIDYGWLWFISVILFWLMQHIHSVVGNWGWSIVLVTVLIRLAFYKLSAKSYKSMAMMRKLQPRIKILQERYSDDKQMLSKKTMELYREEKVNPLGGCLPLLVQIPVFIGLYWVIIESVQLRQAPFILWIHDLAVHDPFYVLPVLMGISMFVQQKISPPPPDPTQAKVMMMLPIIFTIFFLKFPAGLVLYWVVNNTLSITQQWYMMRKYSGTSNNKLPKKK